MQRLIVASDDSRGQHHHHPGGAGPGGAANFFETELTQKTMLCKKASLCLLRLFRTNPDIVVLESWMQRMVRCRGLVEVMSISSLAYIWTIGQAARRSRSRCGDVSDEFAAGLRVQQSADLRATGPLRHLHSHETSCKQDLFA